MNASTELATVLRDFFSASAHYHMAAYSRKLAIVLERIAQEQSCSASKDANYQDQNTSWLFASRMCVEEDTSWQDVEKNFFELFVGPTALATPFASAYIKKQCSLGSESSLGACDIFYALGLGLSLEYADISEHIALELDGWLTMNKLIDSAYGHHTQKANMKAAQRWLLCTHMQQWVPLFVNRALSQNNVTLPIRMALQALQMWLNLQVGRDCSVTPNT